MFRAANSLTLVAILIFSGLSSGCTSTAARTYPDVSFPEISDEQTNLSGEETLDSSIAPSEIPVLRVAVPISSESAHLLSCLFTAKQNGLFPENETGSTISESFLQSITPEFTVETIQTPSTGATTDMFSQWREEGLSPDIIYANSITPYLADGYLLPLSDLLATQPYLKPDYIYEKMLNSCTVNSEIYGIPYSSTAEIIFWNQEILDRSGVESLPFSISMPLLSDLSADISKMNSTDDKADPSKYIYSFYEPSAMLPFIPNAFDSSADWFLHGQNGYMFDNAAFLQSVAYLREFASVPFASVESLTAEDRNLSFGTLDPRMSGRVAAWVGNTQDISYWTKALPSVNITRIPSKQYEGTSPTALTVYPLCISSDTQLSSLATNFAAFLALDEDAILLTERLEQRVGFLPVVSSESVWRTNFNNAVFGERLLSFESEMSNAIYNPLTNHQEESVEMDSILQKYGADLINPDKDLDTIISDLTKDTTE